MVYCVYTVTIIHMSTIQIRVDKKLKKQARKVLDEIGLDMSSAITLYLKQISLRKGLPFLALTKNDLTPEAEDTILNAAQDVRSGKNITHAMNPDELIDYLDRDED